MIRTNNELAAFFDRNIFPTQEIITYKKGDVIIKQDDYIRFILFVKSGIIKCSRYNEEGTEFVQEFLGTGEIIGELEVLLELHRPTTIASLIAVTEVNCLKIAIPEFKNLIANNKELNFLLLQSLALKVRYKALRHSFVQTHSLEQNFVEIKQAFPEVLTLIPKNDLANYLGVTLRSLNRVIKNSKF